MAAAESMTGAAPGRTFAAKAKHVIYLHMVGGPPQMDLYDYKPVMQEWYDKDLPDSVRMGQRLTTMTSGQKRFPIAPSKFKFAQHGQSGMWVTELLPNTAKMVDDMCFIRTMHTEAINHEPAISYMQTGNQVTGRPCLGAWASYGLGSLNENLPTFVVLVAKPTNTEQVQAISARLWSSGYLSGEHAGVSFRTAGDPILFINNPPGVPGEIRRKTLDGLKALNEINYQTGGRPGNAHADSAVRIGLPHAVERSRADRHRHRARIDIQALWRRSQKAGHVRQHGAPGAADGRTRSAVRADLSQQLGHARQRRRPPSRPMPRRRSGVLRARSRPEAARPVRRDADHLGRRIRPHDLFAGGPDEGELRPRPPSALLHDVDGRRRIERRGRSTAKPTISRTTSSTTRSTSTISTRRCCTCWASTTNDSRTSTRGSIRG